MSFSFVRNVAVATLLTTVCSLAVTQTPDYAAFGARLPKAPADPAITAALRSVSADRIRTNIEHLVAFGNRSTISSTETDLSPGTGILAASDWIKAQLEEDSRACGGCLEVHVDAFTEKPASANGGIGQRIIKPTPIHNVYAILRGTDPTATKRMYLVTGHYDTRETDVMNTHDPAPGANDDTSGTAVSLEAARVLSQHRFPATLVFVCVAGEEQGLNGSRHLAKLAKAEGWQLQGVLNNDIVGGDTTPSDTLQNKSLVRVFSQGISATEPPDILRQQLLLGLDNDTPSRELAREVLDVGRTYDPITAPSKLTHSITLHPVMELRLDRFLRGGDHSSFSAEGFPAIRFTEWRENFNHQHQHVRVENGIQYGDLLKFDDFQYIASVARLNIATLATLAASPGMPTDVRVVTTNLDNNTTLKWDAPDLTTATIRYEIVWRPTDTNDWQYADFVSDGAHEITLPISKDNVFFGVRACDTTGHCSQAVPPLPEKR